ncbi:hypothetical protein PLESTB_000648600 [Pleodorina starrii]|uniref:NmrA-like domain-containing protein n=1 Tax=Pleodorina starrii TaxID=330485 RepID=A0A9W6BI63_9CHLO|nr:hypothetical protein PLESTB_000648600 [Pleodorina starrii]
MASVSAGSPRGASRGSVAAAAAAAAAGVEAGGGDDMVEIPADGRILLVGITGVTGRSALQGLLTVAGPGRTAHSLLALTRNPGGAAARALPPGIQAVYGTQVVAGDLDEPYTLGPALRGVTAVYCHALSKDASTADPQELIRARKLAEAAKAAGVRLIMYNSSGGRGCGYGITQMEQKHRIEDVMAAEVPTVALRASMFMEELWKRYTRPGILKGRFIWSTPSDRPVQLVAARDMGLAAGCLISGVGQQSAAALATTSGGSRISVPWDQGAPGREAATTTTKQQQQQSGRRLRLRAIELSGDELSPAQMCEVFAKVQGQPVRHHRAPAWPFWFLARDVFRISRFLTERGFTGDVAACRAQFPGMLTFEDFLRATRWAEHSRSYEDGIAFAEGTTEAAAASTTTTAAATTAAAGSGGGQPRG